MELLYNDKKYVIDNNMLLEEETSSLVDKLQTTLSQKEKSFWADFENDPMYTTLKNYALTDNDNSEDENKDGEEKADAEKTEEKADEQPSGTYSNVPVIADETVQGLKNIELMTNGGSIIDDATAKVLNNIGSQDKDKLEIGTGESVQTDNEAENLNEEFDIDKALEFLSNHTNYFSDNPDDIPEQLVTEAEPEDAEYKKDSIYRAVYMATKDKSITPQFEKAISGIADIHNDILNMYSNAPYEDWDDSQQYKFEKFITVYKEKIDELDNILRNYQWNDETIKDRFYDLYKNVIMADYNSYVRIMVRHMNYLRYRSNRIGLIMKLSNIVGIPTLPGKNSSNLFKYMVRYCDNYPLLNYEPVKKNKRVDTRNTKIVLEDIMVDKRREILASINGTVEAGGTFYESKDYNVIYPVYVKCRVSIYNIFNMFVSNRQYNGYNKWSNYFMAFCDNEIKQATLEKMYDAVCANSRYDKADDYQNKIDQDMFNNHGIYESIMNESWWDEDVKWYKEHQPDKFSKDKILKINMIPTNANVCKILSDGKSVYSAVKFYPGDIIEVCPARNINKDALYSRDMREIVFEVVPHEKWVLPFGYCQYYDTAGYNKEANCEYSWDDKNNVIVIRAIDNIPKHTKLVMKFVKL